MLLLSVFFFQAEDGIRDLYVTGVQTCALPILGEKNNHRYNIVGKFIETGKEKRMIKTIEFEVTSNDNDRTLLHGLIIMMLLINENDSIIINIVEERVEKMINEF